MANIYATPVLFTKQNNVVILFAKVSFGATGVPTLDTTQSKGVCAVTENFVPLVGGVVNSTTVIGTVTSFARLFTGMTVTGTGVQTTNLISSMSAAGKTITMTKQNITTGDEIALLASGGQFTFQFGNKSGVNLDTYNKLLAVQASWDVTSASASGTATQLQLAPAAPQSFVLGSVAFNQRTVPGSSTSGSTDATVQLQVGFGQGTSFSAYKPVAGEVMRVMFVFGNSGGGLGYNG